MLRLSIQRLGSDPQKLFPYGVLLEQFREFGVYAAFVCSHLFPMLYADRKTMPGSSDGYDEIDLQNMFLIPKEFKKDYNKIVCDMLDDMARLNYI